MAMLSIMSGIGLGYSVLFHGVDLDSETKGFLTATAMDLIGIPFSFIFGERLWAGLKGVKRV